MTWQERALAFDCQGEQLVGILATPENLAHTTGMGVLIVVGGPQYRAGSHRQFVQLSRALAGAGHSVLRFDVRGMGDSGGEQRGFETLQHDIDAGLSALVQHAPAVNGTVVAGLCDGASAALMYVDGRKDRRITGLCLLNPWVRSEAGLARTHLKHYYRQRLGQRDFWRKLLSGNVGITRLIDLGRSVKKSLTADTKARQHHHKPYQQAMADGWSAFKGPILLGISELDLTAKEFLDHTQISRSWRGLLSRPAVTRVDIAAADHTLSSQGSKSAFSEALIVWMARECVPAG